MEINWNYPLKLILFKSRGRISPKQDSEIEYQRWMTPTLMRFIINKPVCQSHLSVHTASRDRKLQDSPPSPLPQCLSVLTYLTFLPFICHFLSFFPLSGVLHHFLLSLFPHRVSVAMSSLLPGFHPSPLPSGVCVGSGPYSCFNGTSGFKLLCATCHSSVSASHHCQSIPLTPLRSLSQGPATRLSSAYSQQQSCQCFFESSGLMEPICCM